MSCFPIKAIFFDIDDTLVDYTNANSRVAKRFVVDEPLFSSINAISLEKVWSNLRTRDTMDHLSGEVSLSEMRYARMANLLGHFRIQVEEQEIERLTRHYFQLFAQEITHYQDVKTVLHYLNNFIVGIITNGSEVVQKAKLADAGINTPFSPFVASMNVGIAKPSSEIFILATKMAGVDLKECLMIGDGLQRDVYAAIDSGMSAVWIDRTGIREKFMSNYNVKRFDTLLKLIDFLNLQL